MAERSCTTTDQERWTSPTTVRSKPRTSFRARSSTTIPHRECSLGEGPARHRYAAGWTLSTPDMRRYALREVRVRLHQQRFRQDVLRAYGQRCTVCALRGHDFVQAAHIVSDPSPEGIAAVINGLALCAIHHLAYDRNLLGIDPAGVVHIARSLRDERDGPMLREGLQGFHGAAIRKPRRASEHPDPERLAIRFSTFEAA
jgi:putative restriction endonuclease